jgi:tetratricopeptide (TPR) repeat protein
MDAIGKALAIDPNNAEAYSSLCDNKFRYEYDFAGAEAACRRAVELKPDSPDVHKSYTRFLYSRGRFDEAINEIRKAIDLQPVSYRNQQIYGLALFYARRFPEAEAQFVRLLELNPGHPFILVQLVNICEQQGRNADAFDYFVRWLTATNADAATIERFKAAYARSGWRGFMLERAKMDTYASQPFDLACLYASAGEKDKAFESLETAFRNRSYKIAVLQVTPQLDPLRNDPRYQDLVQRV